MPDDERLLIVQMALGKASVFFMSQPEGGKIVMPVEGLLEVANDLAAIWSKDVLERTGAQGREQDVSDELLRNAISAARLATELTTNRQTAELFGDLSLELDKIQRARAREASSRDDTPEQGQDVSVEMLQRAAVACRSAAAMWSAIPTKSEYWCETADYFDKRARAAGKGEG